MSPGEIASFIIAIVSTLLAGFAAMRANTLQTGKQETDQALANINISFTQMQAINQELSDARTELRAENIAIKAEFEVLRAATRANASTWEEENRQLRTEILALRGKLTAQDTLIAELKAANAELVRQMAELREQTISKMAIQESTITSLRAESGSKEMSIESLRKENERLQARIQELEAKLAGGLPAAQ